jgi:hypothetical protein
MTIRGLGKKKLKTLEKELEKLKQDLKEWDAVNKKGVVGTTNHVLPLQIAEHIRQYEGQIEKLKAKKGGRRTRRRHRGRSTRSTRALTARRR